MCVCVCVCVCGGGGGGGGGLLGAICIFFISKLVKLVILKVHRPTSKRFC